MSVRPVAGRIWPVVPNRSSESTFSMMSRDSPIMKSSSGMPCSRGKVISKDKEQISMRHLDKFD